MEIENYTIKELENIANAWSWENKENRRDYSIIIDFLCFVQPELKEKYDKRK